MSYDRKVEPTTVTQGEQVAWTREYCDFPASLWSLEYRIRWVGSGSGDGVDITATADGDSYDAVITAAESTALGNLGNGWKWQAWATETANPTNKVCVNQGYFKLEKGFVHGTVTATDQRSNAKITLDALDAAIAGGASSTQLEWEITTPAGSRRIKQMSVKELTDMRSYYARLVSNENAAERMRTGKGGFGTTVKARFRSQ